MLSPPKCCHLLSTLAFSSPSLTFAKFPSYSASASAAVAFAEFLPLGGESTRPLQIRVITLGNHPAKSTLLTTEPQIDIQAM